MEAVGGAAEERWASLCNCVVNFLLEEKYHLTALELLQELQEDGRHAQALRLRSFFSDPAFFPPDLVARASSSPPGADPQSLLEEKIAAEEKLALTEYDLRLAKEDLTCLKLELQKQQESSPDNTIDASAHEGFNQQDQRDVKISALGPLKDNERKDLNCAVKEYLLLAGYRLAAMTFIEEVLDQDLDVWTNSSACVPDALRRYYYQYLSSTTEAAEALETIKIVSDALPKIVPYVLINHREELLPLIICAIERHPDSDVRDSLTHTLFNLIKRPDGQQRLIIMDACVELATSVGEMRTETELLPQCWEQINHQYEERRLLVAQSCGELAIYVRPEIRDSLILSIVQQLVEDSATVVREAATHNLALLLPLFPNMDKYYKVEELLFQLVRDPSGVVVDVALRELVPAVVGWGGKLDQILRVLLSHILASAQRCPSVSGVEGTIDSHLRVLGEQERWTIEVLLRMLTELLPFIHQKAIETCPSIDPSENYISESSLKLYATGETEWSAFEWMHTECLPDLIKLACLLPAKEDSLRTVITKYLLAVSGRYGKDYLEHIMLPVFLIAAGDIDSGDFTYFPLSIQSKVRGFRPKTSVAEKIAIICVLPLLLSGILGSPSSRQQLEEYLRKLLIQNTKDGSFSMHHTAEIIDAIRFLCIFEEHHGVIFHILWEMVASSDTNLKTSAAALLKALVPYVGVKVASTHVLPALITLGSDQNSAVKYASIDALGAVAQHFKSDMVVDKIHIQMDAFLEDGSHEATISVIRALAVAVPHSTDRLREYLLTKIFRLTSAPPTENDIERRRERANVFCEALCALDATDLPATSVRDLLLPSIQNLLKDLDALDPAHKEALEVIGRERSGGTLESIGKAMGAHLGIATSVSSFFGESNLLGKKEGGEQHDPAAASVPPQVGLQTQQENTRFGRIMRGGFGDMLRGKAKGGDEPS
ncbi:RAB11-binding protein RELCH homolog isoform X3 [Triticum dicoccoides]|uniref:RAB11-binding protein RELCH homolog isoform X3 n=1 Tax=Triticum dicoccoides TaxID=85692 RepID=UPI001890A823|nr:RAB11-binding protein RELCH homolog isoform X3 [Triticum dicoccoides]